MRHVPSSLPAVALSALCVLCAVPTAVQAQAGAVQPGRVERDTRPLPEPVRRDSVRIDTPRYADQPPPGAQEVRFLLGEVQVLGGDSLPVQVLSPIWRPMIGQSITLAEAFGIASAITARYRAEGFVLSQAVIPPQDIRTVGVGVLRIQVIEGFIDKVRVTGVPAESLAPFLRPVEQDRPLRMATLERSMLLIGELPGVSAQAHLKPGTQPNAADLEVVAGQKRTEFSLSVHNRSAPSQGRTRIEASAEGRGVIGSFDRHTLRLATSGDKKLNLLSYGADVPLGGQGLRLNLGASASRSQPATELAFANLDTRSDNLSLGLAYPVLRSRQSNLSLRGTLNGYDNRAEVAGSVASEDRIRALRLGATGDIADGLAGLTLVDVEFSRGLSALGADKKGDLPPEAANPQFSKWSVYAARLQGLTGAFSALLAATAQGSSQRLPTAEMLGLGGETFLRAFDPSEVIGEKGSAVKLELRYDLGGATVSSTVYAYGETGKVTRRQDDGSELSTSLSSTGVGVRLSGPYRTRGYLELAKPGRKDVASEGNRDLRVFAGLGIDF